MTGRDTPSRRSMVEITNDIVGVREALYDATGSALLAREKCKAEDARIIYEALCRANNVLWTVVEELQAFPSERSASEPMGMGAAICAEWKRVDPQGYATHLMKEQMLAAPSATDAPVGSIEELGERLLEWRARAMKAESALRSARNANAERYEWLRSHSWVDISLIKSVLNFGPGYQQTKPEILDAAIDAELARSDG